MRDYEMGAMEALSWAFAKLRKCGNLEEFRAAKEEVEEMVLRLTSGAAVNFRDKSEFIPEI